jgi:PAS domain-containing protein
VSAKDKNCVFLISREVVEDLQSIEGRLRVPVDASGQGSLMVDNDEPVLGGVIIFLNSAEDLIVDVHEIVIASNQPSPIGVVCRTHEVA